MSDCSRRAWSVPKPDEREPGVLYQHQLYSREFYEGLDAVEACGIRFERRRECMLEVGYEGFPCTCYTCSACGKDFDAPRVPERCPRCGAVVTAVEKDGRPVRWRHERTVPPKAHSGMGKRDFARTHLNFTPLYEIDADEIAPKLAQCSGIASAVYFWLFSRSFACKNEVRVSQGWLAETLGINKRTMARVVKQLQDLGLVMVSGLRGRGGGSVFSVRGLTFADEFAGKKEENHG